MLTDRECRSAGARGKPYKLADANGLYLHVTKAGTRSWRWKYRWQRKEKLLTFGTYPEVSLAAARLKREDAARILRGGMDPAVERRERAARIAAAAENSFETVARRWHERQAPSWAPNHAADVLRSLVDEVFGKRSAADLWGGRFGDLPITATTPPMVLELLNAIENRGAIETAHRVRQRMSAVFVFALASGIGKDDPAAVVQKALRPIKKGKRPAVRTIAEARAMLARIEAVPARPATKLGSRLLALTAVRPGMIRFAERQEFEGLCSAEPIWRVPPAKMKLVLELKTHEAFEFIVPLSSQAVDVVKVAIGRIGNAPYLFAQAGDAHKPMSENTLSYLYKRDAKVSGRLVPHGWRATFSTVMNERAVKLGNYGDREIIDLMLAHKPEGVEAIYNRAAYMPRRRELAQKWADMLLEGRPPAEQLIEGPRRSDCL